METCETLKEMGFTLRNGVTKLIKKEDWGNQLVGRTKCHLKFKGKTIFHDYYHRGIGHFKNLHKEPVDPMSISTIEERKDTIAKYTESIRRLKEVTPLVKRFDTDTYAFKSAFEMFKARLQIKERNGEAITERETKIRDNAEDYIKLVVYTLKDKSIAKENKVFYPMRSKNAIEWYEGAIKYNQKKLDEQVKYEKDYAQWNEDVLGSTLSPPPNLTDLVYCAMMEATCEAYEDWCSNLGYDEDSRKAHKIWDECCDIYDRLKNANAPINQIREILEDY